ncbi:BAG_1a_G0007950.mRNA.1.CDS.1 [Saccharomyces cerevisiae]|nr:SX2_G0042980.mRNA.1.CDS.1 [Saccharomyces cerevisiae]CAI4317467.1 BAG_1a_G0007950.mRNA.1.CDS.1 [Saccharomyces cerevisiae]CAI7064899.1 BAG_1a_G0007950.mRNA.1.CDS.1 [Saccharomyces cerevisiae]
MVKVAILGASGGVGQPLSLLLKLSPYVSELALYDVRAAEGIGKDLSHINTNSSCVGYDKDSIENTLSNAQVVLIPAGVPRKPGLTRDDLFKMNAGIVKSLVTAVGKFAPNARILVISNPVNSLVPIAVETLKKMGKFKPGNVMGVTNLDLVRAETFLVDYLMLKNPKIGQEQDKTTMHRKVTVIGGHSGETIIPIITDKSLVFQLDKQYEHFIHRVQFGGDEIVKAKQGAGSATLSMAFAGAKFAEEVLRSFHNEKPETESLSAFVYLPGLKNGKKAQQLVGDNSIEYFSLPIVLRNGSVVSIDTSVLEKLSPREEQLVNTAVKELRKNIEKGKSFILDSSKL